ncbi:hypothetical protein BRC64_11210 [Halobacteriales archaeon QH_10_67_22]|nr:MAG: hypothetical protein BRC64_11210 [Halobacteriales archaeon QH_10_67_22]
MPESPRRVGGLEGVVVPPLQQLAEEIANSDDWFGSLIGAISGGIVYALVIGFQTLAQVPGRALATAGSNPEELINNLIAFAIDPLGFIWSLILARIIRLALGIGASVIDAILFVFVGSNVGLQREGQLGLSDAIYTVIAGLAEQAAIAIRSYGDALVYIANTLIPTEGGVWTGVAVNVVIVAELLISAFLLYRLLIAVADAIPIVSGIETFIRG